MVEPWLRWFWPSTRRAAQRGPVGAVWLLFMLAGCTSTAAEGPTGTDAAEGPTSTDAAGSDSRSAESATLLRVIDGDSLELEIDGQEVEARLLGVNAPELYGPANGGTQGSDAQESDAQSGPDDVKTCNGEAAKQALTLLLDGEELQVIGTETDRFGRRLVDVTAGDRSTVIDMIELGWGFAVTDDSDLRDRMKQAAADRAGMWGDLCGQAKDLGLVIGDSQVNPAGSDRDNLVEEWVTIVNDGADPVDLSGWEIRDDTTSHRYRLTSVLQPGRTLTVRSGVGTSTEADFYLNESFPVWSNSAETVVLTDPDGIVTTWAFIDPPAGS